MKLHNFRSFSIILHFSCSVSRIWASIFVKTEQWIAAFHFWTNFTKSTICPITIFRSCFIFNLDLLNRLELYLIFELMLTINLIGRTILFCLGEQYLKNKMLSSLLKCRLWNRLLDSDIIESRYGNRYECKNNQTD